jgi:hypothetical protein
MKTINIFKIGVLSAAFLFLNSCSDQLDDIRPKNQIPQNLLNEDDLEKVLNGVYATMENFVFNYYMDGDIKGENFEAGPGFALIDPMQMAAADGRILVLWRNSFTALKQVNFLIETCEASSNQGSAVLKKSRWHSLLFSCIDLL